MENGLLLVVIIMALITFFVLLFPLAMFLLHKKMDEDDLEEKSENLMSEVTIKTNNRTQSQMSNNEIPNS